MENRVTKAWRLALKKWVLEYNYRLIIFNMVVVFLLFLLRSAGYFQPYFLITVNFIVIFSLIISPILLGAKSSTVFVVTLVFWAFAGFLRVVGIDVWAERTGIYAYESLVFGTLLFLFENIRQSLVLRGKDRLSFLHKKKAKN